MKEEVRNLYIREDCKNDFTNVAELIPLMLCDLKPTSVKSQINIFSLLIKSADSWLDPRIYIMTILT